MSKVLVTGGAGYIGSHVVEQLVDQGYQVVVVDNLSTGFREAVSSRATFIEADILDTLRLTQILKDYQIEAVIHLAARLVVPESVIKPLEYYQVNVGGLIGLLQACRVVGVKKIIFSSTAAVYGNPEGLQSVIKESHETQPINPYGQSKLMAEQILKDAYQAFGLRHIILRYFNVAGASHRYVNGQRTLGATHLIKVAAQVAIGIRPYAEVYGTDFNTPDGTGVRDYIHVDDLAKLHIDSLRLLEQQPQVQSEVFNCGYGRGYSVLEVLRAMQQVSGIPFEIKMAPARLGDPAYLVADNSKVKRVLGWNPLFFDLSTICASALQWELKWVKQQQLERLKIISVNHAASG